MAVALVAVLILAGCEFTYTSFRIDCNGFNVEISYAEATVDNTGDGKDRGAVMAVDGAGNVVFSSGNHWEEAVGTSWSNTSDGFEWALSPRYNPITVRYYNPAGGVLPVDVTIHTFTGECPGLPYYYGVLGDGRINRSHIAAPVAIYPVDYGTGTGLHFYAIDAAGQGTLVLTVSPEMIAAVPELPETNTLIASTPDGAIALYRLTTGEYQVNAGEYVVIFTDLYTLTDHYIP